MCKYFRQKSSRSEYNLVEKLNLAIMISSLIIWWVKKIISVRIILFYECKQDQAKQYKVRVAFILLHRRILISNSAAAWPPKPK